jgi:hypothetical protein
MIFLVASTLSVQLLRWHDPSRVNLAKASFFGPGTFRITASAQARAFRRDIVARRVVRLFGVSL